MCNKVENQNNIDLDQLLDKLKSEDLRNKKLMRGMSIIYGSLALVYIALSFLNPDTNIFSSQRLGFLLLILVFALFSLLFKSQYKKIKEMDYSLPVVDLLKKASDRQKFWSMGLLYVFFISLLADIAITMFLYGIFSTYYGNSLLIIVIIQLIYFTIFGLTLFFTYKTWEVKQKPLWSSINKMLEELNAN